MAGYDEYVEGVEAEETTSLDTPLQEVGINSLTCSAPLALMYYILSKVAASDQNLGREKVMLRPQFVDF